MNITTIEIEKEDLATHVELCAQRYKELYERSEAVENKIDTIVSTVKDNSKNLRNTIITVFGTIMVALIGATAVIVAAIINHPLK